MSAPVLESRVPPPKTGRSFLVTCIERGAA